MERDEPWRCEHTAWSAEAEARRLGVDAFLDWCRDAGVPSSPASYEAYLEFLDLHRD